jgi:hypothetical protein
MSEQPPDRASVLAALADLKELGDKRVRSSTSVQSYWFWIGHCMALSRLQTMLGLLAEQDQRDCGGTA